MSPNSLVQEGLSGGSISVRCQQKVNRVACFVAAEAGVSPPRLGSKTVHESWPLTRLLSDVAFVIRTRTVSVARRLVVVAMAVEQLEKAELVKTVHPKRQRPERCAR